MDTHPHRELNAGFRKFLLHRAMSKENERKEKEEQKEEGGREGGMERRGGEEKAAKTTKPLCDVFISSSKNDSSSCLAGVRERPSFP